jgi:hypothetical protein
LDKRSKPKKIKLSKFDKIPGLYIHQGFFDEKFKKKKKNIPFYSEGSVDLRNTPKKILVGHFR